MKENLTLHTVPVPTREDRREALAWALQWERSTSEVDEVLATAQRFAEFLAGVQPTAGDAP